MKYLKNCSSLAQCFAISRNIFSFYMTANNGVVVVCYSTVVIIDYKNDHNICQWK